MKNHSVHIDQPDTQGSGTTHPTLPANSLKTIAGLYRLSAQSMKFPEKQWFTRDYLHCLYLLLEIMGGLEQKMELAKVFAQPVLPLDELQIEYTRLFITGCPHVVAPPYASVYLDRSLQGPYTEKILSFYRTRGFVMRSGSDLPDHLVHQLEFLARLAEAGDQKFESLFLRQLFFPWFRAFAPRVVQESRHPFYRIVVQLIDYFTKEEEEHGIQGIEA